KGTIAAVLRALVGEDNVCAPALSDFENSFGQQPLLGKALAIIPDARLTSRTNHGRLAETLLSISGEDAITGNRKHKDHVTVRLSTRVMILSNELPHLRDDSTALAGRFVTLQLSRSWAGKEDTGLKSRLLKELPGILLWAVEGLRRLRKENRLT